jgi:hypothetical protein
MLSLVGEGLSAQNWGQGLCQFQQDKKVEQADGLANNKL